MSKVIVLDYGMFIHRAGYASKKNPGIPVAYSAMNSIMSCLRKIGVSPEDEIIVACDGRGNWRKDILPAYKGNRSEMRKKSGLDWDRMYEEFNVLLDEIDMGTNWQIVNLEKIEADDVGSVVCRFFKDKEIVLVSFDEDWEMLWHYDNVKIFSPLKEFKKNKKGGYKIIPKNFNPYKLLSKKIEKETTDNLISPILNAEDYENRKLIVSLLELPDFVEQPIRKVLENFEAKKGDLAIVPFPTIREKLATIYDDKDKVITYEQCVEQELKKEAKKLKKKRIKSGKK